jgi:hypothetical protein
MSAHDSIPPPSRATGRDVIQARFYAGVARRLGRLRLQAESAMRRARALDLAERGRNRQALNQIEAIERRWKAFDPAANLPLRLLLIKGYLHGANKQDGQAIDALSLASRLIDASARFDAKEKEYLKCYASVCGLRSVRRLRQQNTAGFHVDFGRVSLDVGAGLKRLYPLRQHPKWRGP